MLFYNRYASVLGPRPPGRINKAAEELAYLSDILTSESVSVSTFSELDPGICCFLASK